MSGVYSGTAFSTLLSIQPATAQPPPAGFCPQLERRMGSATTPARDPTDFRVRPTTGADTAIFPLRNPLVHTTSSASPSASTVAASTPAVCSAGALAGDRDLDTSDHSTPREMHSQIIRTRFSPAEGVRFTMPQSTRRRGLHLMAIYTLLRAPLSPAPTA